MKIHVSYIYYLKIKTFLEWYKQKSSTKFKIFHTVYIYLYKIKIITMCESFTVGSAGKEPSCQSRRCKRTGFDPRVEKIPWRWKWQSTSVFLTGKFHGQRTLVSYSSWGHKESDIIEHARTHACVNKKKSHQVNWYLYTKMEGKQHKCP